MSDKAYTVIGTNVIIDCGTAEEAIAYERELWANQPYAPATPAPLDGHQTPGEFHDYRVACVKCGEPGFLHVSWRPEKYEETS